MDAYLIHLGSLVGIYILMSLSFNLVVGYTGLLNLGHVGLMAIGAYVSAILMKTAGLPFAVGLLGAATLTMLVATLLAIPARKIRGDYYALVTLGFMFVVFAVLVNWESLTRGTLGIPGVPRPEGFTSNTMYLLLVGAITAVTFWFLDRLVNSPFGRALEAVRDDEEVAQALGKPVFKLKVIAMAVSGFVVGLAGALLAHFVQFISPGMFWLDLLIWALAGMMIGGVASMRGTVLGVVVLFFLLEPVRFLDLPSAYVGPLRLLIMLALLLLIVLYKPRGIMGRAELEG
ncbi:branched-chain amino acid ABC transporter permease [Candidatus Uhrbacteria bacterium]|nr:branched-chain amino acid ABC transporter permease [Candidatus Uhrbacteria bacterium]